MRNFDRLVCLIRDLNRDMDEAVIQFQWVVSSRLGQPGEQKSVVAHST